MSALALAIALTLFGDPSAPPSSTPGWTSGRIITTPTLHVGARAAVYVDNEGEHGRVELGLGATVQVTTFAF